MNQELSEVSNCSKRIFKRRKKITKVVNPARKDYSSKEFKFYLKLKDDAKEKIAEMEKKILNINSSNIPLRFKILESNICEKTKACIIKKINQLNSLDNTSSDYHKMLQWIDTIVNIPFGTFAKLPIRIDSNFEEKSQFLKNMKKTLDDEVYGHETAKGHIVRIIAQWISNSDSKGLSIGIHGPMGCGKTSFVKSLCKCLNLPYDMIALGGISDSSYLEGHNYTYEGSKNGKIVDILIRAGCMNPVIFFDELDKISDTSKGAEIGNILIHMTDSIQNDMFTDRYFSEINIDLSRCLLIFSYNDESLINPILKDRLITIETPGYNNKDKLIICLKYMIPGILSEFKIKKDNVIFSEDIITEIINIVDEEKGVRNLKRGVTDIISNVNLNILMDRDFTLPYIVSSSDVKKYVHGKKKSNITNYMYI